MYRAALLLGLVCSSTIACGPPPGEPVTYQAQSEQAGAYGARGQSAPLPANVQQLLEQYVQILRSSTSLEDCAQRFTPIAGGGLVNEDGTLRATVPPYSLKKDRDDVRFYATPLRITRVEATAGVGTGFGATAIRGTQYKIWIGKAPGAGGMPAPIAILIPDGHPTIQGPRVVGIGSL